MKTMVYIDAFNLYYGALKGTTYRWLDLQKLMSNLYPAHQITGIKYFTARVNALPGNPDQPMRQQLYFRALRTLESVSIIEGHYLSHSKRMPLAKPPAKGSKTVKVIYTEEKGSDVNLATHLIFDGFKNAYDCAIVVSADSDLSTPIEMVSKELGKIVNVQIPQLITGKRKARRSAKLQQVASNYRSEIRAGVLAVSQFPDTLTDKVGTFTKPATW
jgi:uncharacterized LabA/DUF88 family protein